MTQFLNFGLFIPVSFPQKGIVPFAFNLVYNQTMSVPLNPSMASSRRGLATSWIWTLLGWHPCALHGSGILLELLNPNARITFASCSLCHLSSGVPYLKALSRTDIVCTLKLCPNGLAERFMLRIYRQPWLSARVRVSILRVLLVSRKATRHTEAVFWAPLF